MAMSLEGLMWPLNEVVKEGAPRSILIDGPSNVCGGHWF